MATHSSIITWRTSRTEEPGGLQSLGLQSWDTTEGLTCSALSSPETLAISHLSSFPVIFPFWAHWVES